MSAALQDFPVQVRFRGTGDIGSVWEKLCTWLPGVSAMSEEPDADGIYTLYLKATADKSLAVNAVTAKGFTLV